MGQNSQYRKQITLDDETDEIVENHIQERGFSRWVRQKLREDFQRLTVMEEKVEELEAKKRKKRKKIHELENDIDSIDSQIRTIQKNITQNEALQKIKSNREWKNAIEQAIGEVREVMGKEKIPEAVDHSTGRVVEWKDAPEPEEVLERKVRFLVKEKNIPMDEEELRSALKTATGVEADSLSF